MQACRTYAAGTVPLHVSARYFCCWAVPLPTGIVRSFSGVQSSYRCRSLQSVAARARISSGPLSQSCELDAELTHLGSAYSFSTSGSGPRQSTPCSLRGTRNGCLQRLIASAFGTSLK